MGRHGGIHGICILIQKNVSSHTSRILGTTSESIMWIHFDSFCLGFEFILGAVYLPCEGSVYHSNDVFDHLYQDLLYLKSTYNVPFSLAGDFNSRTGLLDDFMVIDNVISEFSGYCSSNDNVDFKSSLTDDGYDTRRHNMDSSINNNGRQLIGICQSFDLKIVNGRFGSDKGVGSFTCYNKNGGKSVVDYVIASVSLFQYITHFEVDIFDKCVSDVHCPLNLMFSNKLIPINEGVELRKIENRVDASEKVKYTSFKCSKEKASEFKLKLDQSIPVLMNALEVVEKSSTQGNVDNFSTALANSFLRTAKEVGICEDKVCKKIHSRKLIVEKKPWFDTECQHARSSYFNLKNRIKRQCKGLTLSDKEQKMAEINAVAKDYRKLLRRKEKAYTRLLHDNLHILKKDSPQEYWKILDGPKRSSCPAKVSLDDFVHHFSSLNNVQCAASETHYVDFDQSMGNDELNAPISVDEVIKIIKKLKNNKACGVDLVRNEFLKNCSAAVIGCITAFFNVILESGLVPKDWCLGSIVPIFKNRGKDTGQITIVG